ncbi:class I SAM-dependent methyltransferase [Vicingaceae bacterium]|nr:class I SAM-dependent methyltransferase [Vicingaceae bacterium]
MINKDSHYEKKLAQRLVNLFQSSDYDEETSWNSHKDNWDMFYELSPLRKNIFNWGVFDHEKACNVLELGSGYGAITGSLSNSESIKSITCVEQNRLKYEVAKVRHQKNNSKINFVNLDIFDFKTETEYDYVLVVGEFKYAGLNNEYKEPYEAFLKHAASFLKPNGKLVLAIENQLGHKYLAGGKEDYYQKPYVGISGYKLNEGIRTFTKNDLVKMLKGLGLSHQKFYYPFPDFKMPTVILSDKCFKNNFFDWLAVIDFPSREYPVQSMFNFDEGAFLSMLHKNVDLSVFMNSFLIFASKEEFLAPQPDMLAAKLNTDRHPNYRTTKKFVEIDKDKIEVVEHQLDDNSKVITKYHTRTKNLGDEIVDAIVSENPKKLKKCIGIWQDLLRERIVVRTAKTSTINKLWKSKQNNLKFNFYPDSNVYVDSHALDLIPNNILIEKDNYHIIDLEWTVPCDLLPIDLILDRGIYWHVIKSLRLLGKIGAPIINGQWNVPESIQSVLPIQDPQSLDVFEKWFQYYAYESQETAYEKLPDFIANQQRFSLKKQLKSIVKKMINRFKKSPKIVKIARLIAE